MRIFRLCIGIACLALSGCLSLSSETQKVLYFAIDYALSETPASKKNKADFGNHNAILACAFVPRFGLNQTQVDAQADGVYKALAVQPVHMTTDFVSITGSKKTHGYMMPVAAPIYEVSSVEAKVVEERLGRLEALPEPSDQKAMLTKGVYRDAGNYQGLKDNWQSVAPI